MDTEETFFSLVDGAAWLRFLRENQHYKDPMLAQQIVERTLTQGIWSAFLGHRGPEDAKLTGQNFRENLLVCGLNSRQRAVLELLAAEPWFRNPPTARIYAAEALTQFALVMRGRFPRFLGSEHAGGDEAARRSLYPIPSEDLTNLTLRSDAFDCVITNDCLEHIPDITACLGELSRVLKPGGVMLSTFPFTFLEKSLVKARLVDGQIEYLSEPEYHGNPAAPSRGSLVFTIPGWEVLQMARNVEFSRAEMVFVSSAKRGITATNLAGILVMRCYK
jgi:SAM-dependent methyltransferase